MDLRREDAKSRCRPIRFDKLGKAYFTIGMEHLSFEDHFGWLVGELIGEPEGGFVESPLEGRVFWSLKAYSPFE